MDSLIELRKRGERARAVFDFVWDMWVETGEWPLSRVIHHHFRTEAAIDRMVKPLNDAYLFEEGPPSDPWFKLNLFGVLSGSHGDEAIRLLLAYLEFLRSSFQAAPGRKEPFTSREIEAHTTLSAQELSKLGRVLSFQPLTANFGPGNPPFANWESGIPSGFSIIGEPGNLRRRLSQILTNAYRPHLPVRLVDRNRALAREAVRVQDTDTIEAEVEKTFLGTTYRVRKGRGVSQKAPNGVGGTKTKSAIGKGQVYGARWQLVKPLSEGGQAHTFLVRDLMNADAPHSVLKRLKNEDRLGRFATEIEAIQKIGHNQVLTVQDFNLTDKSPFFVTEFCEGGTLRAKCELAWPSLEESLELFIQIADAVNHAHSQGVIHRDIKPDNIFIRLPGGEPVVGDFGLCFISSAPARHTETKEAVGSRWFMAPEMEDGRADQVTASADIYSLGKLLFWLASRGRIFSREKHRDAEYDLSRTLQHQFLKGMNPEAEHVSRLLDSMIVAEPGRRIGLSDAIVEARRTMQAVLTHSNPVGQDYPQQCTYCGRGQYQVVARGNGTDVYNFGLNNVGAPDWRIFVCGECGHVQLFRPDMARDKTIWQL